MTGWFGQSWGAPVCEAEDHVPTPVGKPCIDCLETIVLGDRGIVTPLLLAEGSITVAQHLECFLKKILPHGPDCPHCRGKEPEEHHPRCNYRTVASDGRCNCVALEDL